jgi:uncharacterized membrane protein YcaP (DUF421 family)
MDTIVRAAAVYLVVLLLFRIAGKRTLSDVSTFDLVLTLIISEALQQALIDSDESMTNAFLLVGTLVGLDIALSQLKQWSPRLRRLLEGAPLLVVERGQVHEARLRRERIAAADVLHAARDAHGLRSMDEIDYALIEPNGGITIVPKV